MKYYQEMFLKKRSVFAITDFNGDAMTVVDRKGKFHIVGKPDENNVVHERIKAYRLTSVSWSVIHGSRKFIMNDRAFRLTYEAVV